MKAAPSIYDLVAQVILPSTIIFGNVIINKAFADHWLKFEGFGCCRPESCS